MCGAKPRCLLAPAKFLGEIMPQNCIQKRILSKAAAWRNIPDAIQIGPQKTDGDVDVFIAFAVLRLLKVYGRVSGFGKSLAVVRPPDSAIVDLFMADVLDRLIAPRRTSNWVAKAGPIGPDPIIQ